MAEKDFSLHDSVWLANTYGTAEQFRIHLSNLCIENQLDITALPPSIIPSEVLLKLVTGYVVLFDKLQERELLDMGAIKQHRKTH